jgi:hypothetical protein
MKKKKIKVEQKRGILYILILICGAFFVTPSQAQPTSQPQKATTKKIKGKIFGATKRGVSFRKAGKKALRKPYAKVIQKNWYQIKFCALLHKRKHKNDSGFCQIEWEIGKDGKVKKAKTTKFSTKQTKVCDCFIRRIKRWSFPKHKRANRIKLGYTFRIK